MLRYRLNGEEFGVSAGRTYQSGEVVICQRQNILLTDGGAK